MSDRPTMPASYDADISREPDGYNDERDCAEEAWQERDMAETYEAERQAEIARQRGYFPGMDSPKLVGPDADKAAAASARARQAGAMTTDAQPDPEGTWYFENAGDGKIYAIRPDGSTRAVENETAEPQEYANPATEPPGTMFIESGGQIWGARPDGSVRPLTPDLSEAESEPEL